MSETPRRAVRTSSPTRRRLMVTRVVQLLVQTAMVTALLLVCAGTVRWPNAWAFAGLSLALMVVNGLYVLPRNPEVIAERARGHEGTRGFDRVLTVLLALLYLGLFVLAGLDGGRFRWAALDWPWALAGGLLLTLGMVPVAGAMAVNRYLETTVRIQSERDHRVVTRGPYRLVRHPMYVGMLLQLPATALLLGSAWALLPALAGAVLLVVRTALEDRTLRADLPGYADYARVTRYRLLPGVW